MYKSLIILAILICSSCNKVKIETLEIPDNLELDLNKDGLVDFLIVYSQQTEEFPVDPIGNIEVVRGKLISLNNNQILKNEEESILYLEDTNLIQDMTISPEFWEVNEDEPSNSIVVIRQNFDGETWQDVWRIVNEEIKETYLVGFKLSNVGTSSLGFIEISIDNKIGQVEILNVEFL